MRPVPLTHLLLPFTLLLTLGRMDAQTVNFDDRSVTQPVTERIGLNLGAINYYDTGQVLRNLVGSLNPGFEPLISQQIWVLDASGTTTSFTIPSIYYAGPENYWTGGTLTVVASQSRGAELGCTSTILTSGGADYPNEPMVTLAAPCAAPLAAGDVVVLRNVASPTPESWWESGDGGFSPTSSNGGKLTSDTTDLCSSCGAQALQMDATASGSTAAATWYFDAAPTENVFVLMNGTFEISFWAKAASQSPTMTVTAQRFSTADFSCGPYTVTPGNAWTQYTYDCTASEQAGTVVPAIAYLSISVTGGAVDLDNLSFQKAQDDQNPTVLRDEVLATLKRFYAISSGGNPGPFRYWLEQNAETLQNWTQPDFAHAPTVAGDNYYVGPNGGGQMQLSLEDYLVICQAIGAEPYLEVPVTFSAADASGLIDFLAASTNTPYGAQRSALGQVQPWTSVFKTIHLSFCNECWNTIFSGQNLPYRAGAPAGEALYDYSIVAKTIFSAMRANPAFSSSSFDLIMNAQTAVNYGMDAAIQRVGPDSIELSDYMYGSVSDFGTDTALWTAAMVEPWDTVADASDPSNFYQSVHDYQAQNTCGANGDSPCQIDLYEWGPGTQAGSIDQQHLDFITAGAGQGVVSALQGLLHLQSYGIVNQSYFALAGFENSGPNTELAKLWGNTVDMGGATNNVRPQFLTLSLVNQSIIGPMYSCPIAGNASLNFQGETNNGAIVPPGSPELNDVPLLYAFCFENGNNRSVVFINTDLTTAHTLTFAGTDAPAGVVTMRQFAPASLDALNEAPTGQPSNATPATVAVNTSTLSSLSGLSLPPYSVTALDYTVALPGPGFSLPAGTYSPNQTVTLSDPVGGTTIYYTTDGSTPTTSSAVYSSPITVASTETISAIAVSSTLTSSVSTAHYTIFPAPSAPQFSISSGSYSYGQTVTISDSTTGTVIYYTTDGSPPTTASALYTGPITLTSIPSETLSAIAVANTLSSPVTSAQFTVSKAKASLYFYPSEPVTSGDGAYFLVETSSSPTPTGAITISINGQTFQSSNQWYQGEVALYETSATTAAGWVVGNNTVTASFAGDNIYAPQTMTATVAFSLIPTTTTLTASNTAPLAGSSVQLTAAIYPSAATGAVTFLDGTTTLGTANLTGGVASYTIPAIAAGTHLYSAVYEGNTNDATSTSSAISVNALLSSSTMLAASAMSPLAGTNVTLTATTAPSAATGTVTFMDGSATLGTASLSNGTASYTVYAILAGTHAYTATYGGSATYTSSTSSAVSVTAQPAAAIFTLGVTNPVTYGNSSTFTLASSQYPAPTGSVTFSVNGVALPATKAWANGQISMSVSSSTQANGWIAGSSNTVTAAFAGDSTYAAQTVTQMGVVFQLLSSTTTLSASNPAPEAGSSVVLTAATAPSAATGTVTFLDGNTTLGNGNLVNGAATWTISAITAGPHAFTAVYAGSSAYSTSTSPTLAVSALIGTTTAISTASTSALTNSSVTLTATTSPSVGTGTVTFLDGTAALGTAALNGGIATYTISAIAAGTHNFTAVYGGSSTYAASTSAPVTVTASNTGAWLSSTFNEFASGHALNGTAPAIDDAGTNWSDPNGDWTYTAGGGITASGSDILYPALINTGQSNYAATFTYPAVGAQLLFRYADPSDYLSVQVYSFGEIGLFATVAGTRTSLAALWPGTPSAPLTVTLNGSTATLTCVDQTVTATIPSTPLSGTELGFFAPSAGFVLSSINVTAIGQTQTTSTTTTLTASNSSPQAGASVTLTATTAPSAATGTVTFLDGTTTLGSASLASGTATYNISAIASGTHSYTAVYGGSSLYSSSTSPAVTVTATTSSQTAYLSTTFNEFASGHALNGTAPAVDTPGSSWSDPNGDWTYTSGGGITASGSDIQYPTLLNLSVTDYAATWFYPAAGAQLLFRYSDSSDYLFVQTYSFGEIVLYAVVGGTRSTLTSLWLDNPAAPLTVTLSGSSATLTCGGETASATIPSTLLTGTQLGFFAPSAGFVLSSLNITATVSQDPVSTTTTLSASSTAPVAGASVTLTATTAPSAATGTVTFLDGTATVGTATLAAGTAAYTISAITSGTHTYTAVYGGSSSYNSSTSAAVSVVATSQTTSTTTSLNASSTAPVAGASVTLTATTAPSAATGTVTFLDGTTTLGSASLASGTATYNISAITAGTHSYTAVYGGSSLYGPSTSSAVTVTATTSSQTAYLSTTFNEFAASHVLNGTAPAVDTPGSSWSDPNGDWTYTSGGGITASGSDIQYPTLLNLSVTDYAATWFYPAAGAQLLFRYADTNNYLMVQTYSFGEIVLYAVVGGTRSTLTSLWLDNPAAPLTVTLSGSSATLTCSGETASATIPSPLLTGTQLGFFAPSAGFVLSSLNVSTIGQTQTTSTTTTLTASNSSPQAGASVTLTATTAPSAATGTVTFLDGTTTLGSASLASGTATYNISAIASGTHSYTAVYGGSSLYSSSTSPAVTVTATTSSQTAYLSTTFNEFAAGHILNGTAPAVDTPGSSWSDPNGDWTYTSGGGITARGSDIQYPTLLNLSVTDYAATWSYPAAGAQLLFRYSDSSDYLFVQTYSFGEIVLYAVVGGTRSTLTSLWLDNPAAPLTVTLSGSSATLTCGGETASATIPSTLLTGTQLGFFAPSAGFVLSSLNVTQ